jgi:periplasmic protein TonB
VRHRGPSAIVEGLTYRNQTLRLWIVAPSSGDSTSAVSYAISDLTPPADIEHAQGNMSAGGTEAADLAIPTQPADRRTTISWLVSALFAIAFHGAIATLMLHWPQPVGASAPAEPIMVELTPVEPAPTSVPEAETPAPEQAQDTQDKPAENPATPPVEEPIADKAEPVEPQQLQADDNKPEQPQELVSAEQQVPVIAEMEQKSEIELPAKKQEIAKPVEKKKQEPKRVQQQVRAAKRETAKPVASQSTRTAAAAAAPSGGPSPSDWRSEVIGILERNKRYPSSAESNHEEGTTHLAFTIDRQGRVTSAHIAGSSGSAALDTETLALVHRVSIPPPPAEMAGAQISLVVSLRYNIPHY